MPSTGVPCPVLLAIPRAAMQDQMTPRRHLDGS
jgi:hypothetical protein